MRIPTVGFAGLTPLGVTMAAAAAERGFDVVGFDPEIATIARLERAEPPVTEPHLPELLRKVRRRLTFTAAADDLGPCDLVYVAGDVPTDDSGTSDLEPIHALVDRVVPSLSPDAVLVVLSQVPPGFTRGLGRRGARTFYQVETLVVGRAVERALHPERFVVGCADPEAPLPEALAGFLGAFGCPVLRMRYESAELAKIAINVCLAASVSAANTLAELAEKIGADWREIVPALRLDPRIGQHAYLAPGLGFAGGNLERDLVTVCRLADACGADAGVVRAWIANSRHRRDWVLAQVHERVLPRTVEPVLAVLGLAYKPDTASTRNSPALALLSALRPFVVRVYDPFVRPDVELYPRVVAAASALDACDGADALVILTPWAEFGALEPPAIAARLRGVTVIDPHAVLDRRRCWAAGLEHVTLGSPPPETDR